MRLVVTASILLATAAWGDWAADGMIYLVGGTGETLVLRSGKTPDVLARNKLGMRVIAAAR
jgi:hypothetical protein